MSIPFNEKLKAIRKAEGFTQVQFAELTGISISTIKKIDSGVNQHLHAETLQKVASVPDFQKYALWLLTDQVNPEGGQISPEIKQQATQLKTGS